MNGIMKALPYTLQRRCLNWRHISICIKGAFSQPKIIYYRIILSTVGIIRLLSFSFICIFLYKIIM